MSAEPIDYRTVVDVLGRASLACFASSTRYWTQLSDILARHYPAISRGLLGLDGEGRDADEARGTLLDGARACLRELAELPAREAQRLAGELEHLGETLRGTADESPAPRRRRWRVKA